MPRKVWIALLMCASSMVVLLVLIVRVLLLGTLLMWYNCRPIVGSLCLCILLNESPILVL